MWIAEWLVRATALQTGVGLLTAENMQMMMMNGLVGMADSGYTGRAQSFSMGSVVAPAKCWSIYATAGWPLGCPCHVI